MVFNGVFERFLTPASASWRAASGWFVMCLERFDRSHSTHMEYQLRDDDMMGPGIGDSVQEYIQRQIDNDRLFIGCEGEEPRSRSPSARSATNRSSSPPTFPTR